MTIANVASEVPVNAGQLLTYLGLRPDDPKAQAVVAVCNRYDLDPLLKHVIVIPGGGVYITRDGLLHIAHRSGRLDGIVVEQEPTLSENGREYVARVSVYRKDMKHPFTFPGRYAVAGRNKDYPQEMSLKAAEAHALRRAFDVSGLPTQDEYRPEPTGGLGAVLAEQVPTDGHFMPADDIGPGVNDEPLLLNTSSKLAKAMYASIHEHGIPEDERIAWVANVIGRDITSTKEMTEDEARDVLRFIDDNPTLDDDERGKGSAS